MQQKIAALMAEERIDAYAALPYDLARPTRSYLIEKIGDFSPRAVLLFLVPYYAGETENLSLYAAARDYHAYMQGLFSRLCPALSENSRYRFYGFADHSPIDERHAAVLAGLGVFGENRLLLNEKYGSFVFIGAIFTDAPAEEMGFLHTYPIKSCVGCGACRAACPGGCLRGESEECLSAITQKKGSLTEHEEMLLRKVGSVWGCDICQTSCPYNAARVADGRAFTPIPWFREQRLTKITRAILDEMTDAEFAARAFSFRGRAPLLRNLDLLEN